MPNKSYTILAIVVGILMAISIGCFVFIKSVESADFSAKIFKTQLRPICDCHCYIP